MWKEEMLQKLGFEDGATPGAEMGEIVRGLRRKFRFAPALSDPLNHDL